MQNSTRPNKPELDATKVPTDRDIAWAAGIYEGEGCCRLCGHNKRSFMASVAQKDPEILHRLRDWFGGNVRSGRCGEFSIHNWDICGDRARIFMALIYEFMTVRRKVQIDAANALDFMRGESPVGLSIAELKSIMDGYYADHKEEVKKRVKDAKRQQYLRYSSDPEWKKRDQEKKAAMRASMTKEEKEASLLYAKNWYQRKKILAVEVKQHELEI
jgi:hypothetical protein